MCDLCFIWISMYSWSTIQVEISCFLKENYWGIADIVSVRKAEKESEYWKNHQIIAISIVRIILLGKTKHFSIQKDYSCSISPKKRYGSAVNLQSPYRLLSTNHKRNQVTSNGPKRPQTTPKEPFAVAEAVTEIVKPTTIEKSRLKGGSPMSIVDGFFWWN